MVVAIGDSQFSEAEMASRLVRVRRAMIADGVDALIVMAPDSQYWPCGLESFISGVLSQALIVPADDAMEPILIVWDADVPIARETTNVGEIRGYRSGVDDPVQAFRAAAAACAPTAEVIGFDASSRAVPHALGIALTEALAPTRCIDCSALLAQARLVKSLAELALLRRAGAFAPTGLQAALDHARPDISERRLAAEIEYAMRSEGSDYPSIPTELSSGTRSALVHATPSHRTLQPGDLVHAEVGGVERRYNAVALQTFHIGGAPPPPAGVDLYEVARECLRAGLDAIRPGVPAPAVEAPALEILREAGLGERFQMRFGYGVGAGYPPTWLDPFQITRTSTDTLEPGIAFVLHACLHNEEARVGVLVGGTYTLGEAGVEMLAGAGPIDLQTA
jgi:Xaa-Pro dipeptidase